MRISRGLTYLSMLSPTSLNVGSAWIGRDASDSESALVPEDVDEQGEDGIETVEMAERVETDERVETGEKFGHSNEEELDWEQRSSTSCAVMPKSVSGIWLSSEAATLTCKTENNSN